MKPKTSLTLNIYTKKKGIILLACTTILVSLLATYSSSDACLNVASSIPIHNIFGKFGAIMADLLYQNFGLAIFAVFPFMLYLSIRWFFRRPPRFVLFKTLYTILLVPCLCLLFSLITNHQLFSMMPCGGRVGVLLKKILLLEPKFKKWIISSSITLLLFYPYAVFIFGSKTRKVILKTHYCSKIFNTVYNFFYNFFAKIFNFVAHVVKAVLFLIKIPIFALKPMFILVRIIFFGKKSKKAVIKNNNKENKCDDNDDESRKIYEYVAPTPDLLKLIEQKDTVQSQMTCKENMQKLSCILGDFGVRGDMVDFRTGPIVTLYEFKLQAGVKASRVIGLSEDIARTMMVSSVRIATISGRDTLGLEVPNKERETVCFRKLIESNEYIHSEAQIPMILGCNIFGKPIVANLADMPHLLIAGTTGSGKSVGINGMILSMLYKLSPEQCRLIMIDPKMLEFSAYEGIPHLMMPVITDAKHAVLALKWVVREMENRYRMMSDAGVRNITGYNEKIKAKMAKQKVVKSNKKNNSNNNVKFKITKSEMNNIKNMIKDDNIYNNANDVSCYQTVDRETYDKLSSSEESEDTLMQYIVVIIDEMADLMVVAGKEIEVLVQRLSQMARAAGIHLIMATQRPSVDVITGVIKANFPTRISYHVTSKIDSRTILGEQGAEQLLGKGDLLFMLGGTKTLRVHGPLITDSEVENVVNFLKNNNDVPDYITLTTDEDGSDSDGGLYRIDGSDSDNAMYRQAINIVLGEKKTSISYLQRKLRIGYNKAANFIEQMESDGILSSPDHSGKRMILKSE